MVVTLQRTWASVLVKLLGVAKVVSFSEGLLYSAIETCSRLKRSGGHASQNRRHARLQGCASGFAWPTRLCRVAPRCECLAAGFQRRQR